MTVLTTATPTLFAVFGPHSNSGRGMKSGSRHVLVYITSNADSDFVLQVEWLGISLYLMGVGSVLAMSSR